MKMDMLVCVAVSVTCVLAGPMVDAARVRYNQTKVDMDMDSTTEQMFSTFKRVYDKAYDSDYEESVRMGIFDMNVQYIIDHNVIYDKGEKSYYLGVNQFTDMTHAEFLLQYTGHIPIFRQPASNSSAYHSQQARDTPEEVDWRKKGCVTSVKNQGPCNSGWAFSTTGSIEAQLFMKTGTLISLSAQQLIDCPERSGNKGCNGGVVIKAFESTMDTGGIDGEDGYPYVEKQQSSCLFNTSGVKAILKSYTTLPMRQEWQIQNAVAWNGPISITIDASHPSFRSYAGGIYDEPECSQTKLNHAVLAVGYGKSPSAYWLVKNSWGTTWGESGYIRMTKDKGNQCGIATRASYPGV